MRIAAFSMLVGVVRQLMSNTDIVHEIHDVFFNRNIAASAYYSESVDCVDSSSCDEALEIGVVDDVEQDGSLVIAFRTSPALIPSSES